MWAYLTEKLSDDEYEIIQAKLSSAIAQLAKVAGDLYEFSDALDTDCPFTERMTLSDHTYGTPAYAELNIMSDAIWRVTMAIGSHENARREIADILRG